MSDALNQKDVDSLLQRTLAGGQITNDSLTQREIDAILQHSGPASASVVPANLDVTPYNFVRPPRLSKDKRATLDSIHTRLAISLQSLLSSQLRVPVDVTVNSVEQAMFSEFVLSLANPCAAFVFSIGGRFGGEGALDLSTELSFHLIDRLFGGPGDSPPPPRGLTALEQGVVRGFAERAVSMLREAWVEHFAMTPRVAGFEANPEMLQITNREDNVLVSNLEVRSAQFGGFLTLCLPMSALESFLNEKSGRQLALRAGHVDREDSRRLVAVGLRHAHVDVRARFPLVWLPSGQVARLAVGAVINMAQGQEEPVDVLVNGRLRFRGGLGQVRQHVGLRISEVVHEPEGDRPVMAKQGRLQ